MATTFNSRKKAVILLQDGAVFYGKLVGDLEGTSCGNISFNTSMTGYQEVLSDLSNSGQLVVGTNPHIGNYGISAEDGQSDGLTIAGLICKNFSYTYSRAQAHESLEQSLKSQNIMAVSDVDTRALATYIREKGEMSAAISTETGDLDKVKKELASWTDGQETKNGDKPDAEAAYFVGDENALHKIAVLNAGVKSEILAQFGARDCYLRVFPYDASYDEISGWNPDAYLISNGPGDPKEYKSTIDTVKTIISQGKPLFGIGLGHQIIALANGLSIYKMKRGHRGINHPVLNQESGLGEITSQNHLFAVDLDELQVHPEIEVTHKHLNDGSVAGMTIKDKKCFSVQYQPEAAPGPHDSLYLFDKFMESLS